MEREFLIDTNGFINVFSERYPEPVINQIDAIVSSNFFISVISKLEMLGFKNISSIEERAYTKLIRSAKIIHLHDGVIEETITLRKTFNIKLPDAIITASCLSINAVLLTSNTRDFKKISNLKVVNPLQLI